MPETKTKRPEPVSTGSSFTEVFDRAPAKDRANIQRHLDALAAMPSGEHSATWKKVVSMLAALAPHALQTVGQEAIRFFVADGRYRLQLFALEDKRDGELKIYLPNVLDEAIRRKLIKATKNEGEYILPGAKGEIVRIDALDANNTVDAPPHFKFMIGLNRKALRFTMPAAGRPGQLELAAALSAMAAKASSAAEAARAPVTP